MTDAARGFDLLLVDASTSIDDAIRRQVQASDRGTPAGISLVVDADGILVGTFTDGDLRRFLAGGGHLTDAVRDAMNPDPIVFSDGGSYHDILERLPHELESRGRRSRRFLGKIVLVDDQRRPTRVLEYHELWEQRVATHRHVVVVGLGYVGLTLALVLAEEGFLVTGTDVSPDVVATLERGEPHVHELGLAELLREQIGKNLFVANDIPDEGDVFVITVGTPVSSVDGVSRPSLTALDAALRAVGTKLQRGALVILRSTVPIGTCRTIAAPILEEESGLRAGIDFHLSFAPERTTEGQALEELRTLPQIIGGINDDSVDATAALFRELSPTIVRTENLEAAELAKLINNSFRDLAFAFANQIAQVASGWGFDVVEAIRAANRGYPRNPVPLPSPGVGGPCLTKDPYILAAALPDWAAPHSLFDQGRAVNDAMHGFVARSVVQGLRDAGKDPATATVLLAGLAFKGHPETGDLRGSSSLEIAALLAPEVGRLLGHDPVVEKADIEGAGLIPADLPPHTSGIDAVVFLNNHLDYQRLDVFELVRGMNANPVFYDGWHSFRADEVVGARPALYLGLGWSRSSLTPRDA